jgi:predicted Zn-dependent protease
MIDPAFLWVFLAIGIFVGGLAAALPKFWQTTPDDFSKGTVRVSVVDLIQAWSLSRSAARAEARGDFEAALLARRAALINNLGNPRLHRSLLTHLQIVPEARPENVILVLFSSSWLLSLTETNLSDLGLTTDLLEKYRLPEYGLHMLHESPHGNDPALAPIRARCSLSAGKAPEFAALWRTYESVWDDDPRQKLYHDAWTAGWESSAGSIEAMFRLKEALQDPGNPGLTAARLLLLAGARRGTPDDLAMALARLESGRAASVAQHAIYWRFLASVGRFEEASEKARAYSSTPRLSTDAAEYALVLAALGMRDEALGFLDTNLSHFATDPGIWEVYLALLIDARRWNDVRRAAAHAQVQTASFETVRILALFAQYQAEVGEDRRHTADGIANELASARILDNAIALTIAQVFLRDDRGQAALKLLRGKQPELSDEPKYWQTLFTAALHQKDVDALRESTTELLRLLPDSPVALSNRAAMLLVLEEDPTEALEITFRLVNRYPGVPAFQINHAFSLLLNRRIEDAWTLLESLDPSRLDRQAAAAFRLARTEALFARGAYAAALEESAMVPRGLILPPQVERLEKLRRELHRLTMVDRKPSAL